MENPIPTGTKAPDFSLPAHTDEQVSLSQYTSAGKNVVLFFYPLDWTPV